MANKNELEKFLKNNEKKAFRKINYQIQNEDDSLDIVQEAMIKLIQNYQDRSIEEISMIFNTILHNCMIDFLRKKNSDKKHIQNFDFDEDIDSENSLMEAIQYNNDYFEENIEKKFIQKENLGLIKEAISKLPTRQSEAFLLRYMEELSIEETAKIMNCAEGSVKTHCSRAVQSLKETLKNYFSKK